MLNLNELTSEEIEEADAICRRVIGRELARCDRQDVLEVERRLAENITLMTHERDFLVSDIAAMLDYDPTDEDDEG